MNRSGRLISNAFLAQSVSFTVASLTTVAGSAVDGMIIGRYMGSDAVAAFGMISPLMTIFAMSGSVLAHGARTRFVHLAGAGKIREANAVFSLACVLSVVLAAAMMILSMLLASPVSTLVGATAKAASLLPQAKAYLLGITSGLPPLGLQYVLWSFMPIDNDRRLTARTAFAITASNIALDLFVVLYKKGGTFDIGLATSISNWIGVLVLLTHFTKKDSTLRFTLFSLPWMDTFRIVRHGLGTEINRLGITVSNAYMNRTLATVASAAAIAGFSIFGQAHSLIRPFVSGIADTVAVLSGIMIGEENRKMMKHTLLTGIRVLVLTAAVFSILLGIFAREFASLFIADSPETLDAACRAIRCYAIGLPLFGLNLINQNYLQGIGRHRLSLMLGMLSTFLIPIPFTAVASRFIGADAVWYGFPIANAVTLAVYGVMIAVFAIRHRGRVRGYDRVLLLPEDFDGDANDVLDRSITEQHEISPLAREVWDFCEAHGCDRRRTYLMSLSVEEMAGNVILHGFTKDKKTHSVEVRVLRKGDSYILRIRDDCVMFDPMKRLQLYSEEDPTHHMGIRMIVNMAEDVQYTNLLDMNNLVVRL